MSTFIKKLAGADTNIPAYAQKYAESSPPKTFVPMTADDRTYAPPGALFIGSADFPMQHPYGRMDHYYMTPKQAYFQAFGNQKKLAEQSYNKAMKHRLNSLKYYSAIPNSVVGKADLQRFSDGRFVPVFPKFLVNRYQAKDARQGAAQQLLDRYDGDVTPLIMVAVGRQHPRKTTSFLKNHQGVYQRIPDPGHLGVVLAPFLFNSEQSEAGRRIFRTIPGIRGLLTHELSHAATDGIYVGDENVSNSPNIKYTSNREGYGNSVLEAHGGMHQLKGWFARHFGYVPDKWEDAVHLLARNGYIQRDPKDPYNSYRFTSKFNDKYTSGPNTTLEDQFTNMAYAESQRPGPWASKSPTSAKSNTPQDEEARYILDRQQELWDTANNRKVNQNTAFG